MHAWNGQNITQNKRGYQIIATHCTVFERKYNGMADSGIVSIFENPQRSGLL